MPPCSESFTEPYRGSFWAVGAQGPSVSRAEAEAVAPDPRPVFAERPVGGCHLARAREPTHRPRMGLPVSARVDHLLK